MMTQMKDVIARNQDTIVQDAVGVVSLVVMLFVVLHLPAFF